MYHQRGAAYRLTDSPSTLMGIPAGAAGVRATLELMARLVRSYRTRPALIDFTRNLVQHLPQKDYIGEAQAVFSFVQNQVRYVHDPANVETLYTPDRVIELRRGDCDDKAALLGTMLSVLGLPVRFVAVGSTPNTFEHVYLEALIAGHWVALDATEPQPFGWSPPNMTARMVVNV